MEFSIKYFFQYPGLYDLLFKYAQGNNIMETEMCEAQQLGERKKANKNVGRKI
jgi:hypothetical protein